MNTSRQLYFAYGRNMHVEIMTERCPEASIVDLAVLSNYRIMINGRGVSTIVADSAHRVHGVLWRLTEACEAALDIIEGVAKGHYLKDVAHPQAHQGPARPALVYIARDVAPGPPREGYLESLEEAAAAHGFPNLYRRHLSTLRHV